VSTGMTIVQLAERLKGKPERVITPGHGLAVKPRIEARHHLQAAFAICGGDVVLVLLRQTLIHIQSTWLSEEYLPKLGLVGMRPNLREVVGVNEWGHNGPPLITTLTELRTAVDKLLVGDAAGRLLVNNPVTGQLVPVGVDAVAVCNSYVWFELPGEVENAVAQAKAASLCCVHACVHAH